MTRVRRCVRCGCEYPERLVESAFRTLNTRGRLDASKRRWLCRACEQTGRDQVKVVNRWPAKARDTIRRHALRLGIEKSELIDRYGWDPKQLAHEAEHHYGNGCSYCFEAYDEMGHGLADITLDIVDRSKPPNYRTNTKWCCQTCNRKKSTMSPEEWEADSEMWRIWKRHKDAVERDPQGAGLLF